MDYRFFLAMVDKACEQARTGIVSSVIYAEPPVIISITPQGKVEITYTKRSKKFRRNLLQEVQKRTSDAIVEDARLDRAWKFSFWPLP